MHDWGDRFETRGMVGNLATLEFQLINFFKQDNPEGDVKPFKAFHYNGLGVREADGSKKVSMNEHYS